MGHPLAYDGVHFTEQGHKAFAAGLWRNSNETNHSLFFCPSAADRMRRECRPTAAYQQITQEEAKEMMDTQEVIILDVREQDEYDSGHIPGAVLLPVGTIDETTAAEVIPEKDSTVLVYCRSGNRSKTASSALADLGYTNIYEFGGINTWPYETESKKEREGKATSGHKECATKKGRRRG